MLYSMLDFFCMQYIFKISKPFHKKDVWKETKLEDDFSISLETYENEYTHILKIKKITWSAYNNTHLSLYD